MFKRAHALFIDNAETTTDLIQVESGKNRRMAIEETCDPVMVMSHYLKRAPKLLKPVKRGGPVPLLSTSTEIRQPKGSSASSRPGTSRSRPASPTRSRR